MGYSRRRKENRSARRKLATLCKPCRAGTEVTPDSLGLAEHLPVPGTSPEAQGEGRGLTAATAASGRHAAPHPLVGRPPLRSWRGRCARAAEGLRQEAGARPRGRGYRAKVRRGPECQGGRAGGRGRGSSTVSGPVVFGRGEGCAPGRGGRGARLHVSVAGEVGVLRGCRGRGRGAIGLWAQAETRGPGGARVHRRVLVQHIAHVHGGRGAPRACWALERRGRRPDDQQPLTWPRRRRCTRPTQAFYSSGRPRPQPGRVCISKRGEASGLRIKGGNPSGARGSKGDKLPPQAGGGRPELPGGWGYRGSVLCEAHCTATRGDRLSLGGPGGPVAHPACRCGLGLPTPARR